MILFSDVTTGIVRDIMSILGSHPCTWSLGGWKHSFKGRFSEVPCFGYYNPDFYFKEPFFHPCQYIAIGFKRTRICQPIFSSIMDNGKDPGDSSEGSDTDGSSEGETEDVSCVLFIRVCHFAS